MYQLCTVAERFGCVKVLIALWCGRVKIETQHEKETKKMWNEREKRIEMLRWIVYKQLVFGLLWHFPLKKKKKERREEAWNSNASPWHFWNLWLLCQRKCSLKRNIKKPTTKTGKWICQILEWVQLIFTRRTFWNKRNDFIEEKDWYIPDIILNLFRILSSLVPPLQIPGMAVTFLWHFQCLFSKMDSFVHGKTQNV